MNGAVQRTYTYGLSRISQNQLLNSTWTTSVYGYDGMGSVRLLTDATGAVTDTYDYDTWGNLANSSGSTRNVYLYRGEQFDPDLRIYYLRARYFNPLTGRFLSRDPAASAAGSPATLHKYMFASSDPVDRIDPTGRVDSGDSASGGCGGLLGYVPTTVGYFAYFGEPSFFSTSPIALKVDICALFTGDPSQGSAASVEAAQASPSTGGKKTCNPCAETDDILKGINNARRRLDNLRRTGTAADPGASPGTPGGISGCASMYTRNGQYLGSSYNTTLRDTSFHTVFPSQNSNASSNSHSEPRR